MNRSALVLCVACLTGVSVGLAPVWAAPTDSEERAEPRDRDDDEFYALFKMLADAVDQVERNYVTEVSRQELIEAAVDGVIRKLDPYSSFIKPEEMEQFRNSMDSNFSGIGIRIVIYGGQLTVLSPLVGTPAYRAGLRSGDRILEIDGEPTDGIALAEAVRRIKGPVGSRVVLTVEHAGGDELETVHVERQVIRIESVLSSRRKKDDTWNYLYDPELRLGYIRLTVFSSETPKELREALEELRRQNVRGLVLDLRFNPGGLLSSAIEVADLFVAEGRIVTISGRNTKTREVNAHRKDTCQAFPIAVLVNRYSASGSEILAACLQDQNRAIVIGERTWGKGSVQNVIELDGGRSALKLTTSRYLRPNGENIHRFPDAKDSDSWGVKPNSGYEVRLSEGETLQLFERQQQRDLIALKQIAGDQTPDGEPEPTETEEDADQQPDEAPSSFVDRQLEKALAYLSQELASDR